MFQPYCDDLDNPDNFGNNNQDVKFPTVTQNHIRMNAAEPWGGEKRTNNHSSYIPCVLDPNSKLGSKSEIISPAGCNVGEFYLAFVKAEIKP